MRTTLNIDAKLLERVVEETGERNRGRAIDRAMKAFLKHAAIERLLAARGTFKIRHTRKEWEEAELEAMKHGHPRR